MNGNQHAIFRRALSYHAFVCYNKWNTEKGPDLVFSTDCDLSAYSGAYKDTRANYLNQLRKDMKAKIREDDEEEDA